MADNPTRMVQKDCSGPPQHSLAEPKNRRWKWRFHLRSENDEGEADWWFCSTAIPLIAATTGPLANVMSIAALVTSWRNDYDPASPGVDAKSTGFADPHWCLGLNGASLACGFIGNIFLLFNFTRRIRYIVALPATIIFWYFATGILIAITISMNEYVPPHYPDQVYSQGFWHAVIAACLYLVSSMILMLNMLGYFLGHYPQHFELSDDQRNLILQTMMFFIWLAGGAAVFAKTEGWSFVDALYFCDVTVLTVGFGDFHPVNDVGRGLVFPYSVGGIIILGLMVSSIHGFAKELGTTHVVKTHAEKKRTDTLKRTATTDDEFLQMRHERWTKFHGDPHSTLSAPTNAHRQSLTYEGEERAKAHDASHSKPHRNGLAMGVKRIQRARAKRNKILLMKEEKDRFDTMRRIQHETHKFKRYYALTMSVLACMYNL